MLSKTFFSTVALALAAASPAVRAQLVNVPLGVSLDVGTQATCPADAPPGTDVDATVLAVVTLNTVVEASLDVAGLGLVGADIGLDVDVCLCIDATVAVGAIELPVNLEAAVIEDVSNLVDGLDLAVTIPGFGTLEDLLDSPLVDVTVTTSGEQVSPCTCPEGARAICSNATCSCDCGPGLFYNPVTQQCVVAPSGLARVKRHRTSLIDTRQAKRAEIEARLRNLAK